MALEKIEVVSAMLHGFNYKKYFTANTKDKLSIILAAEEYVLGIEDGKKRFIDEVTKLSSFFAIAIPHDRAMNVKDKVSFFQSIKACLVKFTYGEPWQSSGETETAIRQVIDKALVSSQVVDIFDAAGIKKPDISILSEEFLIDIRGMEHKNIALETMKKLLNDEIKTREKKNLIQSRSIMAMLEYSIKRYHNKAITSVEVLEEVIKIAKEIREMDQLPKDLGLTDYEYAFYTAVADNESAKELMQKNQLRDLAVNLAEKVKNNTSIDWTIKENVKAKLQVVVKRTLRQFDYPPDMEKFATENGLKQAELMADDLTK